MPHCAVIWCHNQSKNVNKQNSGVTYHRFPKDPWLKDKWIIATGKCNWFPQNHDTICSYHFEARNFKKCNFLTLLFPGAIPTLKLHPFFSEGNSSSNTNDIDYSIDMAPAKRRKVVEKISKPASTILQADNSNKHSPPHRQPEAINVQNSPQHLKYYYYQNIIITNDNMAKNIYDTSFMRR